MQKQNALIWQVLICCPRKHLHYIAVTHVGHDIESTKNQFWSETALRIFLWCLLIKHSQLVHSHSDLPPSLAGYHRLLRPSLCHHHRRRRQRPLSMLLTFVLLFRFNSSHFFFILLALGWGAIFSLRIRSSSPYIFCILPQMRAQFSDYFSSILRPLWFMYNLMITLYWNYIWEVYVRVFRSWLQFEGSVMLCWFWMHYWFVSF